MNRKLATMGLLLLAAGCSSSSGGGAGTPGDDGGGDGSPAQNPDATMPTDSGTETGSPDAPGDTSTTTDGGGDAPQDSGGDADASPGVDASCTGAWLVAPSVAALALPDGGVVILHAAAAGTQDYACVGTPIDGGIDAGDAGSSFLWTLQGPDAVLMDCHGGTIGHHFASEAGATRPEWMQFSDSSYVIARKVAAYDAGSQSVPWVLLQATSNSTTGTLSTVTYVQRLDTDGGVAPATGCDYTEAGTLLNVPYSADYFFYVP